MQAEVEDFHRNLRARILDYWRAIELLSPQNIPRLDPDNSNEPVRSLSDRHSLVPWKNEDTLAPPREGKAWRFTLYCGVYSVRSVRGFLARKFGPGAESFDGRPDSHSCLFTVSVTQEGRALLDTFTLSSCPWAIGRILKDDLRANVWLDGFDSDHHDYVRRAGEHWAVSEDDEPGTALNRKGIHVGRPLTAHDIFDELESIAETLGVSGILAPSAVRFRAWQIRKENAYRSGSDGFLNSFFIRDLKKVASETRKGNIGKALAAFLASDSEASALPRDDVRQQQGILWDNLSPAFFPQGRWPGRDDHPLYASQQLAVNLATTGLNAAKEGLFAINGPPGTGKTTLLREIIASVVVERAKCLAALNSPKDAFEAKTESWKPDGYSRTRTISSWKKQFMGFEMVVASSNNGAVNNVTLEVPDLGAIDEMFSGLVDYFSDFGTRILQKNAWAMIAAQLGKSENRRRFCDRFWFAEKDPNAADTRANRGFLKYLQTVKPKPNAWKCAVKAFTTALAQEQEIRRQRLASRGVIGEISNLENEISILEKNLQARQDEKQTLSARLHAVQTEVEDQNAAFQRIVRQRGIHRSFRPGMMEILLTLGNAFREWRKKDLSFASAIDVAEKRLAESQDLLGVLNSELADHETVQQALTEKLTGARKQLHSEQAKAHDFEERMGVAFPRLPQWFTDEDARELSSPWADKEWNQARTKVFIEALHLHRAFIECDAGQIRQNLHGVVDLLQGKVPPGAPLRGVESAWATLFFLVPVVSTTFASFDRLFSHLGCASLGWLMIDEAGQSVPQAAVGALWRSKRAVVVGDPLQLEPISTLPFKAQQTLRKHFGVGETWLPRDTSVQKLADRVSRFGTFVKQKDSEQTLWVGCPLRVHRRCAKTIFDISNKIAYGGQMTFATPVQPNLPLPPSCWIHVAGLEARNHWIFAEGFEVERLLGSLLSLGLLANDVLLVSPFRTVAQRLRSIGKRYGVKAGTVHILQGKETQVLVLVLGGHPDRPRAKDWASEKPNLLNVAVSRAKQRLYIIGNRDEWSSYPYFAEAAELLPQSEPLFAQSASRGA